MKNLIARMRMLMGLILFNSKVDANSPIDNTSVQKIDFEIQLPSDPIGPIEPGGPIINANSSIDNTSAKEKRIIGDNWLSSDPLGPVGPTVNVNPSLYENILGSLGFQVGK